MSEQFASARRPRDLGKFSKPYYRERELEAQPPQPFKPTDDLRLEKWGKVLVNTNIEIPNPPQPTLEQGGRHELPPGEVNPAA